MVSHAFICWVLVCFLNNVIIFDRGEQDNAVSEGSSGNFHKIIQKTEVIEYFHGKLADLKPEKNCIRTEFVLHENFVATTPITK